MAKSKKRNPDGSKRRHARSRPVAAGFIRKREERLPITTADVMQLLRENVSRVISMASEELTEQMNGVAEQRPLNAYLDVPLDGGSTISLNLSGDVLRECVHYSGVDACMYCDADEPNEFEQQLNSFYLDQLERVAAQRFEEALQMAYPEMMRQNETLDVRPFKTCSQLFIIETGHVLTVSVDGQPPTLLDQFTPNKPEEG